MDKLSGLYCIFSDVAIAIPPWERSINHATNHDHIPVVWSTVFLLRLRAPGSGSNELRTSCWCPASSASVHTRSRINVLEWTPLKSTINNACQMKAGFPPFFKNKIAWFSMLFPQIPRYNFLIFLIFTKSKLKSTFSIVMDVNRHISSCQYSAHYTRWQHHFTEPKTILDDLWPHFLGGADGVYFQ